MINKEIYCRRQHRVRNMFYFFYSYIQKKYFLVFLSKQWRKVIFIPFLPFRPIFFNCLYCNYVCTRLHGSTIILLKEVQYIYIVGGIVLQRKRKVRFRIFFSSVFLFGLASFLHKAQLFDENPRELGPRNFLNASASN